MEPIVIEKRKTIKLNEATYALLKKEQEKMSKGMGKKRFSLDLVIQQLLINHKTN